MTQIGPSMAVTGRVRYSGSRSTDGPAHGASRGIEIASHGASLSHFDSKDGPARVQQKVGRS